MKHHRGRVEVICGSMFSGKTEELIRRVRRAQIAKQQAQVFKPAIDTRYSAERVTSHDGQDYDARPCNDSNEIAGCIAPETTVVAIDEAQLTFRTDPAADVAGGGCHQAPRDLHDLRGGCQPHATSCKRRTSPL